MVGSNTVGRVKAAKGRLQASSNVNVSELIESPEAKEVFNQILEDSGFKSGVSGVQPKILGDQVSDSFETSITPTHILKSSESNTPYLSINEYICMTMASNSNIEIPGIQLSKDGEILAVTRFDLDGAGLPIGFEKAATLSDKPWLDKYSGAMEDVINIIDEHVEVGLSISNLEQIFRATVVNCIVKNGDAHMKNFGFIYGNELGAKDIGLSPTYDVVCTTAYLRPMMLFARRPISVQIFLRWLWTIKIMLSAGRRKLSLLILPKIIVLCRWGRLTRFFMMLQSLL